MKTNIFTKKEIAVLTSSALLSVVILSSMFWVNPQQPVELGFTILGAAIRPETTEGLRVNPFYTVFFTAYEANAPEEDKQAVRDYLNEKVPILHSYTDRRHDYFLPGSQTEIVHNLKQLNATLGSGEFLAIDEPFYRLLELGLDLTILTHSHFNIFIGSVSDFWDDMLLNPLYPNRFKELDPLYNPIRRQELMRLLQYVPIEENDVRSTLELKEENGQYYARFHAFGNAGVGDLKITLGAIGKGFFNDVLADGLTQLGLERGFINNGGSSITAIGPRYGNRPYTWQVTSPIQSVDFAYSLSVTGHHRLSTSGAYTGVHIPVGNQTTLRHHILDPRTGYPTTQAIEINVISKTFSAGGLDALSTAFMSMTFQEANQIRQQLIALGYDLEIGWIEIKQNRLHVSYTTGYEAYLKRSQGVRYHRLPF